MSSSISSAKGLDDFTSPDNSVNSREFITPDNKQVSTETTKIELKRRLFSPSRDSLSLPYEKNGYFPGESPESSRRNSEVDVESKYDTPPDPDQRLLEKFPPKDPLDYSKPVAEDPVTNPKQPGGGGGGFGGGAEPPGGGALDSAIGGAAMAGGLAGASGSGGAAAGAASAGMMEVAGGLMAAKFLAPKTYDATIGKPINSADSLTDEASKLTTVLDKKDPSTPAADQDKWAPHGTAKLAEDAILYNPITLPFFPIIDALKTGKPSKLLEYADPSYPIRKAKELAEDAYGDGKTDTLDPTNNDNTKGVLGTAMEKLTVDKWNLKADPTSTTTTSTTTTSTTTSSTSAPPGVPKQFPPTLVIGPGPQPDPEEKERENNPNNAGQMGPRMVENANIVHNSRGDAIVGMEPAAGTTDVLRASYTEADPRLVVPNKLAQIRSDIEFDMFSVVRPGFGLGANNKLFVLENQRDSNVIGHEPLFTPRTYDGPNGGPDTTPLLVQDVIPPEVYRRLEQRNMKGKLSVGYTAQLTKPGSSLNILGDDYGQLDSISERGLKRNASSFLEPVIRVDNNWFREKLPTGSELSRRSFRKPYDSLRYPEHFVPHVNMDGGPLMKKSRVLQQPLV
jgi:hypothetical protein